MNSGVIGRSWLRSGAWRVGLAWSVICLVLLGSSAASEPAQAPEPAVKVRETDKDTFQSGGRAIKVWRFEPDAIGVQYPAILLLHGADGLEFLHRVAYRTAAQRLAAQGYVVLIVHYFDGLGLTNKELKELREPFRFWLTGGAHAPAANPAPDPLAQALARVAEVAGYVARMSEVREKFDLGMDCVKDAVAYARKLPNVNRQRIGAIGLSLGGYLATAAVTEKKVDLQAVVVLFGGLPREMHARLEHLPPTLLIHGDRDQMIPVQEAYGLHTLLAPKGLAPQLQVYAGCGHLFFDAKGKLNRKDLEDAERRGYQFLAEHLR